MSDWKSLLKADPIEWLLEKDNPSVRYFTLTDILGKPGNDPVVKKTKEEIMKIGVVPKILDRQEDGGYWGNPGDFYIRSKYKGTVWQLIILAEYGVDVRDRRIKKACEFIFKCSQDIISGGFSYKSSKIGTGGSHNGVIPCLTGNMVWSLIKFGYLEDKRVKHGIECITNYQRFDDGIYKSPKGWPYDKFERCWGKHTCHMGAVKALKALVEIPASKRSKDIKNTIKKGAEYILKHHIYKRSHNLNLISKPELIQLGFPLIWKTDILEILEILTKLGYRDKRMQEALDLLISKQDDQGKWKLESTFNGRVLVNIEKKGKPSKWVTLNAIKVLKRIL